MQLLKTELILLAVANHLDYLVDKADASNIARVVMTRADVHSLSQMLRREFVQIRNDREGGKHE